MSAAGEAPVETVRVCLALLDGQTFAFPVHDVREILVVDDVTIVPRAAPCVVGVTNYRGEILPLVDVQPVFRLPARHPVRGGRALVVETETYQVGLVVDDVIGLETLVVDARDAADGPIAGWLERAGARIPQVDVDRLLNGLRAAARGVAAVKEA